jgi:protein-S-isoprenylcysteine O-methyltransferase Ste14
MYRVALMVAWFAGTIYATIPLFCLGLYPFSDSYCKRRPPLHLVIPAWFVMVAVVDLVTWPWHEAVLYHTPVTWVAAALLFVTAIIIYRHSRLDFLHVRVVGRIEPKHRERPLVTGGIRQHIRHPIYLAHLCMLLAWTVGSGEVVLYGLTVFALVTGWPMVRQEEMELERRFGDEYRAYIQAVPARFLPRVFRFAKRDNP